MRTARQLLLLFLSLAPLPAVAGFECSITQSCTGDTCTTARGGTLLLRELDDAWQVITVWEGAVDAVGWVGYQTSTRDEAAAFSVIIPSSGGKPSLISFYQDGDDAYTVKITDQTGKADIIGTGTCMKDGGS
jgi:hypothetical protein